MKLLVAFISVLVLVAIPYLGITYAGMSSVFGIIVPYAAVIIFILGFVYRIVKWARSPVPFRIPTTCGQEKSLPWIKQNKLDNPSSTTGVVGRMALEVLFFRSLFRNTRTELRDGPSLAYGSSGWLWLAAIAFHWSFLVILIRHFRLFSAPVPYFINVLENVDGFLQIGIPTLYITDVLLLAAVLYLFIRRIAIPQVRYISLVSDYFPLFLIFGIGLTGVLMRYFYRVNVIGVKELVMGLIALKPNVPADIGSLFFIHLFLISALFAYLPFSKLMHMGGVFFSPTRNLANNNRMVRHINPWNYPVHVHTYAEYEDDFRDKMKSVGLPVEKE
jgi:nitrate reductase gamma subunit